ncbi:MAG: CHAT domain-containing protein [Planctomycetes bacterium]|nr:CHAT domain-containing protein [Planctomycetota bacterium]
MTLSCAAVRAQDPDDAAAIRAAVDRLRKDLNAATAPEAVALLRRLSVASETRGGRPDDPVHAAATDLASALANARPGLGAAVPEATESLATAIAAALRMRRADRAAEAVRSASHAHASAGHFTLARTLASQGVTAGLGEWRAIALLQLATVEMVGGHLRRVEELLDEAAGLIPAAAARADSRPSLAAWRTPLRTMQGRLYLELGLIDLAHAAFTEVRAVAGASDPWSQFWTLEEALAAEDHAQALAIATELLRLAAPPPSRMQVELRAAIARARVSERGQEHLAVAQGLLESTLVQSRQPMDRARLLLRLAALDLEAGSPEAARPRVGEARTLLDGIRDFELSRETAALAVLEARLLMTQTRIPPAEAEAAHTALLRAQERLYELWRGHPPRPAGIGYLQPVARRDLLATLIALELRIRPGEPGRALRHLVFAQSLGSTARRLGLGTPDTDAIRRDLAPRDGGILVYLPAAVGSHVFAITPTSIEHFPLGSLSRARALAREVRAALRESSRSAATTATAAALRDEVLPEPLSAHIAGWRALAIVGRDLLAEAPFEALPDPDGSSLGTRKAIWYLPSLPLGMELRARAARGSARADDLLLVAATEPAARRGSDLPPLVLAATTLAELAAPFRKARVVSGRLATRSALLTADLSQSRMLTFLGHGVLDAAMDGDERPAALVFAGEGPDADPLLRCADVERLVALPPLVILAACSAASGPTRRGDDQGGHLAGAFLYAGARSVVASTADLDLATARRFVHEAHAALAAGSTSAEAMRRVRAVLEASVPGRAPAGSALLHVFGLGDERITDARDASDGGAGPRDPARRGGYLVPALLLGSGLILAAAALLLLRRRHP